MGSMRYLELFENFSNKSYINTFLVDFGFFITLNLSQITKMGINDNATLELNKMMKTLRKPIINGNSYSEIIKDVNYLYSNPKLLSALFSIIRDFLLYIEPRIDRFVIDSDTKNQWLEKIRNFKQRYKNIII